MKVLRVHHLAAVAAQEYLVVEDLHLILLLALAVVLATVACLQTHIEPEVAVRAVAAILLAVRVLRVVLVEAVAAIHQVAVLLRAEVAVVVSHQEVALLVEVVAVLLAAHRVVHQAEADVEGNSIYVD